MKTKILNKAAIVFIASSLFLTSLNQNVKAEFNDFNSDYAIDDAENSLITNMDDTYDYGYDNDNNNNYEPNYEFENFRLSDDNMESSTPNDGVVQPTVPKDAVPINIDKNSADTPIGSDIKLYGTNQKQNGCIEDHDAGATKKFICGFSSSTGKVYDLTSLGVSKVGNGVYAVGRSAGSVAKWVGGATVSLGSFVGDALYATGHTVVGVLDWTGDALKNGIIGTINIGKGFTHGVKDIWHALSAIDADENIENDEKNDYYYNQPPRHHYHNRRHHNNRRIIEKRLENLRDEIDGIISKIEQRTRNGHHNHKIKWNRKRQWNEPNGDLGRDDY